MKRSYVLTCLFVSLLIVQASIAATPTLADTTYDVSCQTAALVEAINTANGDGQPATLNLAAGCVYTLTAVDNVNYGPNGLPSVTSQIIVNGDGATIERSNAEGTPDFRIFFVAADGDLTLNDLTLRNGRVYGVGQRGGAIYNRWGRLSLNNSVITGSGSRYGGGIQSLGILELTSSTVSDNQASAHGGGILASGSITLTDTVVNGNHVLDGTGGGMRFGSGTSTIILVDSTVSGNSATQSGGGIENFAVMTLINTSVSYNAAGGIGGGIANIEGRMTLTDNSVVVGNTAGSNGGGIALSHAEGGFTTLDVVNSTITGNIAMGDGGGIYNNTATAQLTNSTVSGNSANYGGGIYHVAQFGIRTLTMTNSTVSGNTAVTGGGIYNLATLSLANSTVTGNSTDDSHAAGGVYNAGGTLELINTIVAAQMWGEDCIGLITSLGHNLDSDDTCGLAAPGDLPNTDPRLGPLADNGGPTETHALLPGSPAIDAGDDGVCPAADQRGVERPQGAACDIGAYEYESIVVDPTLTVNSTGEAVDVIPGDGVCETVTPDECTLQAAIMEANALDGPNIIELVVPGPYVLATPDYGPGEGRVPSGVPLIDSQITINGYGATIERSSVGGAPEFRIFYVVAGGELTLNDLTLRNGWVEGPGGAIWNNAGTLELNDTLVSGNRASEGGGIVSGNGTVRLTGSTVSGNRGIEGGGIYNVGGTLELMNSTVNGNWTEGAPGGGIWTRGGMVRLTNSTISRNSSVEGGGILNDGGTMEVTNSTISSNVAGFGSGGGIWNRGGSVRLTNSTVSNNRDNPERGENENINNAGGTLELINTIVADQLPGRDCVGSITSLGHNLDSDGTCNLIVAGDIPNTDPRLGPLADNGGPTETHALLPGSPAIDAGDDGTCVTADQRGVPRPQGAACDIGAYEYQNSAPVADDDAYTVAEDEVLDVTTPDGVLNNDNDVDNDPLSAVLVGGVSHGALTLNPDGSFAYTPEADFNGQDTFTYKANDGYVDSNEAIVTIHVEPVNDVPQFTSTPVTVATEDVLYTYNVWAADRDVGEILSITAPTLPAWLGLEDSGGGVALLSGTPSNDDVGEHSVELLVEDAAGYTDMQAFSISVANVNDPPVAVDDAAASDQDLPLTVDVLANDFDIEGDALTVVSVTQGAHGSAVNNGDGTVTYTRHPEFNGTDSFSYTVSDGQGGTDSANVKITITPDITIPEDVTLGDGVIIGPGSTIKSGADIGDGATIGSDVTIGQDATIGAGATIEDGAELKSGASLGADSTLGAGAQLKEGVSVGDGAQIGADVTLQGGATAGDNLEVGAGTTVQADAELGNDVTLGSGVFIGKSAIIGDRVSIGDRTQVKEEADVGADTSIGVETEIGKRAQIGVWVSIGNDVTVKAGTVIPDYSVIPDGAVVS